MFTAILSVASLVVAAILAWIFRQHFTPYLPRKTSVTTAILFVSIVLLTILALLPELCALASAANVFTPMPKVLLALVAAVIACVGCSKQADQPVPQPIRWRGPETGFTGTTNLPPDKPTQSMEGK